MPTAASKKGFNIQSPANNLFPADLRKQALESRQPGAIPTIDLRAFAAKTEFHKLYQTDLDTLLKPVDATAPTLTSIAQNNANPAQQNSAIALQQSLNAIYAKNQNNYQRLQDKFDSEIRQLFDDPAINFADKTIWPEGSKADLIAETCQRQLKLLKTEQQKELKDLSDWLDNAANKQEILSAYNKQPGSVDFAVLKQQHIEQLKQRHANEQKQLQDTYANESTRILQAESNFLKGELAIYFSQFLSNTSGIAIDTNSPNTTYSEKAQEIFEKVKKFAEENGYLPVNEDGSRRITLNKDGSIGFQLEGTEEQLREQMRQIIKAVQMTNAAEGLPNDYISFNFTPAGKSPKKEKGDASYMNRLFFEEASKAGYMPNQINIAGFTPKAGDYHQADLLKQNALYDQIGEKNVRDMFKQTGINYLPKLTVQDIAIINTELDYANINNKQDLIKQLNDNPKLNAKYGPQWASNLKDVRVTGSTRWFGGEQKYNFWYKNQTKVFNEIKSFALTNRYLQMALVNAQIDGKPAISQLTPQEIHQLNRLSAKSDMKYDDLKKAISTILGRKFNRLQYPEASANSNNFDAQFCPDERSGEGKVKQFAKEQARVENEAIRKVTLPDLHDLVLSNDDKLKPSDPSVPSLFTAVKEAVEQKIIDVNTAATPDDMIAHAENLLSKCEIMLSQLEAQSKALADYESKVNWSDLPDDSGLKTALENKVQEMRQNLHDAYEKFKEFHDEKVYAHDNNNPRFRIGNGNLYDARLVEKAEQQRDRINDLQASKPAPRLGQG